MTKEQIDAIRARIDAATPGPWLVDSCLDVYTEQVREIDHDIGIELYKTVYSHHTAGPEGTQPWHDTHFMAHAREDVPALLAEVERLTADPLPAAAWVREVERAAFQRGVAAMREAAVTTLESAFAAGDNNLFPQGVAYGLRLVRALPDPEDTP